MPQLTELTSSTMRGLTGQSRELASALDIRWLGFSYLAFRLIHTLRDRQTGHLPAMQLDEYLVYMLFSRRSAPDPSTARKDSSSGCASLLFPHRAILKMVENGFCWVCLKNL